MKDSSWISTIGLGVVIIVLGFVVQKGYLGNVVMFLGLLIILLGIYSYFLSNKKDK